ncbi:antibiotic biosynthesis monooxygenase [Dechloromonas denitrificans]|uniref:antibiotic biosynthesis monooxygenase n=1 Tax=Dechloromonas denitrificans TaxID=281362 RepID=UPI001CF88800|nr:antibiotic biosynthesis monooxygenase [Dechloromonas denitrificans]UCV02787.1 antibiotic biosynthesis monooxygenase [Dechloromonas denitrificans]
MSNEQTAMPGRGAAPDTSVTLLIQQRVRPDAIARYEQWLRTIAAKAAEYPGHQGVHIIRPPAGNNEYSILIRFASGVDAERWTSSADRRNLLAEIADAFERDDQFRIQPGIEFWFTPPFPAQKKPAPWKQWLITTSVIWPLTMLIPPLFTPVFAAVPVLGAWGISHGIVAATIVALVVFLIMPRYVRLVSRWLFES